jgi:flagellar hook-associated protein 3 FlgL
MTADNALYHLQQGRSGLDALQEQISSGLNVNRPSDDPLTTRQLLDLQEQISAGDQYSSNITKASLMLNVTNTALSGMADTITQIKKIAGDMVSGSTDPVAIASAVSNLTQLKSQLLDYGNTQLGNQYVFAGYKNSQPFDSVGNFSGTDDALNVSITQGSQVATNVSGGPLLRGGYPTPAPARAGATAGQSPVDIIGSITDLINGITSNNTTVIKDAVKNMQTASSQVNASISDVAGRLVRLTNVQSMITNNQNTLKGIYGDKQNVDYAKAGVLLSQQTTAFNAALSSTAKISQLSLLDYLK